MIFLGFCTYRPINGKDPTEMQTGLSLGFTSVLMIPVSKR